MPIDLATPIDLYVKIANSGDAEALSQCFAPSATVRDEGHSYEGLAAIKEWMAATRKKYDHTVEPLGLADRRRKDRAHGQAHGQFPGQPGDARFQLRAGRRQDRLPGDRVMSGNHELQGKRALVTGGTKGVGAQPFARAFRPGPPIAASRIAWPVIPRSGWSNVRRPWLRFRRRRRPG